MDIRKQALWNTVGNGVYLVALWLLTVITTRLLGYAAAGDLTLAMAVGNVSVILQGYNVRGFHSSDVTFQFAPADYLRARFVTAALGLVLCLAVCLCLGYTGALLASILLFLLIKSSEAFSDVLFGEMQRWNRLELVGYCMLLRGILTALAFFAGAFFLHSLNAALLLAAAATLLLTLLFDLSLYRRTVAGEKAASPHREWDILRNCLPLVISALFPIVVAAIPRVALERLYGAEFLGYYGNVSAPTLVITSVVPVVLVTFFPGYGRAVREGDRRKILKTWGLTSLGVLAFGLVCLFGAMLLARPVLALVYTEDILPYVRYLYPLLGALTLYALIMCSGTALIPMRENKALIIASVLSFILCLAVSYPMVRAWGMAGAAATLAVSYGTEAVFLAVWLLRLCLGRKDEDEP